MFLTATSCGDDEDQSVSYQTQSSISTMDPQLCKESAELTAAANCFEGLMRIDENGKVTNGFAKSYNISKDGLTYTFKLRNDGLWSDKETKVTADDFVFGITRALLPETKSPFAALLYSIKNAEDVNAGKKSSSQLGVKATDDETVVITLEKLDHNLLYALANPVAFPCNREFFNSTKGKYGLDRKNTLTNGSFYIKSWSTDTSLMRFSRFDEFSGTPATLSYFSIGYNRESAVISDNVINEYISMGSIPPENLETAKKSGSNGYSFYNITYCLYIDPDFAKENPHIAKALLCNIDKSTIDINLPIYLQSAKGIVSPSALERDENFRDTAGDLAMPDYNVDKASKLLDDNKNSRNKLSGVDLYYPDNQDFKLIASVMAQTWQKDLNAYINIKPVSETKINTNLKDYTLAIVPIKSNDNTAYGTMINLTDYGVSGLSSLISGSVTADKTTAISKLKQAEQKLIDANILYPLVYSSECYAAIPDVSGLIFSRSGSFIDFRKTKVDD
ncbi:MAG: hypothetical protein IJF54_02270 [Clostridia bacterium]|nr:hypothetical protein [Clostridia bacterium]